METGVRNGYGGWYRLYNVDICGQSGIYRPGTSEYWKGCYSGDFVCFGGLWYARNSSDHFQGSQYQTEKKKNVKKVYFHAITDGRDTDAMCALKYIDEINNVLNENSIGHIGNDYESN